MLNYWDLLPKNNKAIAYKAMCFIKYLLDLEGIADFKAETIANKSNGLFNKSIIGRTLGLLQCKSEKKAERVNGKPNRRRYWNAQTVYSVYSIWGIDAWDLEQCISIADKDIVGKQGNHTAFSGETVHKETIKPTVTTSYKVGGIPEVNVPYFREHWDSIYDNNYSYVTCYELITKLSPLISSTFRASKTYGTDSISPCMEIAKEHTDSCDYPFVNQSLLNKIGLTDLDINLLPTKYLHRLITMVKEPTRLWHLPRVHKEYISVHHLCFNRSCVNYDHLMVMLESLHTNLHNSLNDQHPYYNPCLAFNKVETKTLLKPIKPASNVVPFYKINRHNGVKYNRNLMIDLEDGTAPFKITELPSSLLHNFKEGFNYKGK